MILIKSSISSLEKVVNNLYYRFLIDNINIYNKYYQYLPQPLILEFSPLKTIVLLSGDKDYIKQYNFSYH